MMNALRISFAAMVLLALVACGSESPQTAPLAGARMGGPFTLTNQDGQRVSDTAFAGRYRLVYFGYTFCPDVCPVDVQKLMTGLKRFEAQDAARAAKVQPIFITVDPARDTPAALKAFVRAFHPRLIGLTGSETQIKTVSAAYGVYYERHAPDADGGYSVDHSATAALYGPKGEPVALLPHDQGPDAVAATLAEWVR
jgi:protein SCO1